jgi:hypothetical protein
MNAPLTLAQLAAAWQAAKADEKAANARRLEIEEQIVDLFPVGVEGTDAIEQDGVKVKVTHKLTRTVDTKALQQHWNSLSAFAQDVFNWRADVSLPAMRRLQENHPDLYPSIAVFITSKPAKPAVSVEEV